MKCGVHEEDLSALFDEELEALEERRLKSHLAVCGECRRAYQLVQKVAVLVRSSEGAQPESAPLFVDRVVRASRSKRSRPRRRVIRAFPLPVAAAAALLLVIGLSASLVALAVDSPVLDDAPQTTPIVAEYRARAAATSPEDAAAHLDLMRWCRENDLADEALAHLLRAVGADPSLAAAECDLLPSGDIADAARAELAELPDLGPGLPPPLRPEAPVLTPEERYRSMGLARVGDRWLTPEAYGRLRAHREQADLLVRAEEHRRLRSSAAAPPPGPEAHPVGVFLASLAGAEPRTNGGLTIVPVTDGAGDPGIEIVGVARALEERILLIKENRSSATITARNRDPERHVFLAAGEIIAGGHQDRILTRDTLIPPRSSEDLPVLCCEEGRFFGLDIFGKSPGMALPGIRRLLLGVTDQDVVWARIKADLEKLGVASKSNTRALRAVYETGIGAGRANEMATSLLGALKDDNVVGFMAYSGGRLLGGEVFGNHSVLLALAPRYLESYALESLRGADGGEPSSPTDVGSMLDGVTAAAFFTTRAATFGRETEFEGEVLTGVALVPVADSRPLHVSLFPTRDVEKATRPVRKDAGGSRSRDSGGTMPPPPSRDGPAPGSEAERRLKERQDRRRAGGKIEPPKPPDPPDRTKPLRPRDPNGLKRAEPPKVPTPGPRPKTPDPREQDVR